MDDPTSTAPPVAPAATLYYFHDPMCSWCWAFKPVWLRLVAALPPGVAVRHVLGGLAPDTDQPMPAETREMVQNSWRRILQHVPQTELNFDFWALCQPRRATYAACRAVIAARRQAARYEELMNTAIQRAYYTQARNPSDDATLIELASEVGLDVAQFRVDLDAQGVADEFAAERAEAEAQDVDSYPTLMLVDTRGAHPLPLDYLAVEPMLERIRVLLARAAAAAG